MGLEFSVPRMGPQRAGVFLGSVVKDQVNTDAHAIIAQYLGHGFKILRAAKLQIDRAVVHDGAAAIAVTGPRLDARHEMHIGDVKAFQVVALAKNTLLILRKVVQVENMVHIFSD